MLIATTAIIYIIIRVHINQLKCRYNENLSTQKNTISLDVLMDTYSLNPNLFFNSVDSDTTEIVQIRQKL